MRTAIIGALAILALLAGVATWGYHWRNRAMVAEAATGVLRAQVAQQRVQAKVAQAERAAAAKSAATLRQRATVIAAAPPAPPEQACAAAAQAIREFYK